MTRRAEPSLQIFRFSGVATGWFRVPAATKTLAVENRRRSFF